MSPLAHSQPRVERPERFTPRQWHALRLLWEAWNTAQRQGCDVWQFAVEIGQFHAVGLSHTELRLLLYAGYLEHAWENTGADDTRRTFRRLTALTLSSATCFVLSRKGWDAASRAAERRQLPCTPVNRTEHDFPRADIPCWDSRLRRLWWQDLLVKEYTVPAVNQETVLQALEEEGWPARIDDPLPPKLEVDPKVRLHDTIKALNRSQQHRLLRFRAIGSGRGIHWETVECG